MEQRMITVELEVKQLKKENEEYKKDHKDEIKELKDAVTELSKSFDKIISLIRSIKWWLIGAVSMVVISELGIIEFVKLVLGV